MAAAGHVAAQVLEEMSSHVQILQETRKQDRLILKKHDIKLKPATLKAKVLKHSI